LRKKKVTMTPEYFPLLDRIARTRRAELLKQSGLDPAADPLVSTSFDAGLHTVRFDRLPDEVLDQLHTVEHFAGVPSGRIVRRRVPLWVKKEGCYELPNRLVPLLEQFFRRHSGPQATRPAVPDVSTFAGLTDPLVPAALSRFGRVVVKYGTGVRVAAIIADLLIAHPEWRIAVVCSNRRDVGQVTRDLRQAGVDAKAFFEFAMDECPRPRVAVGTPAGLASPSAAVEHVDLVIVLDPAWFCGQAGIDLRMVENLVRVPWLGLMPGGRSLSPLELDLVTAFFGPFHLELPAHGQVRRQVLFARQEIGLPDGQGVDRMVMALAMELATRDRREAGEQVGVVGQAEGITGPVVVLAHDAAHRHALRQSQGPAESDQVRVVTPHELSRMADVGVLVRADRRPQCPPLSPQALVQPQPARSPLLVVDAFGPDDDRLADRRSADYRAEGWASLAAYQGGYADWERWTHRQLPGRRHARPTTADR
jgi:hypothetical protein